MRSFHPALGMPLHKASHRADPKVRALTRAGVKKFHQGLICLTELSVDKLQYMEGTDLVNPPEFQKRSLIAVIACCHDLARIKGKRFSPTEMEKADFDECRIGRMRPTKTIAPWQICRITILAMHD